MSTITIETNPVATVTRKEFDLVHSFSEGANYTGEVHTSWVYDKQKYFNLEPRLIAAIMNCGFACKWFADQTVNPVGEFRLIRIVSDIDGLHYRHGKEHNVLYDLLFPVTDYEGKKNRSLYFSYMKYLGRILQLSGLYKIHIILWNENEGDVNHQTSLFESVKVK